MTSPFRDLGVSVEAAAALERLGITAPFPVQEAAIPHALAGRDIAARAPTGSGKTIAFGLPLVATVDQAIARHPRALVLAPTRELTQQIARDVRPFAKVARRRVLAVFGGTSIAAQRRELNRGVDVLVACPGRLLDLVEQRIVDLSHVDRVVLDEADRMADMGFLPSVRRILDLTAAHRQVLLFSATLDGDVATLVREYQHDPVEISVGDDDAGTPVEHVFHDVGRADRPAALAGMLDAAGRTIVFCRTRHGVDRLAKTLTRTGVRAVAIHGGHAQSRRTRALSDFKEGRVHVLVATDVAARGIHVEGIEHVVHFDVAEDAKAYLHRSGRTARAGAGGNVVSFVIPEDASQVAKLRRELGLGTTDRPARAVTRRDRPRRRAGAARGPDANPKRKARR